MAATLYNKGREAFATKLIDWVNDDIRLMLVATTGGTPYTFAITDQFLTSVPAGARVATMSASLANKTATNGILDADDPAALTLTGTAGGILYYLHTGVDGTARLLIWDDASTGLPITSAGGTVPFTFDNGANKIAKI